MAVTLQRYTTQEVVLHDYRIPPKVSAAAPLHGGVLGPGGGWHETLSLSTTERRQ